jgi:hypothetical protein
MSDTPLTDNTKTIPGVYPTEKVTKWWVDADFARGLERELNKVRDQLEWAVSVGNAAQERAERRAVDQKEYDELLPKAQMEILLLKKEVARLEQVDLDHAEDWAFCGLDLTSKTAQGLVLRDENRKLKVSLAQAEEDAKGYKDAVIVNAQIINDLQDRLLRTERP